MHTINTEEFEEEQKTPYVVKSVKPPTKPMTLQQKTQMRAQSVDKTAVVIAPEEPFQSSNSFGANGADIYAIIEEPLRNPDIQYKQVLEQLKSGDWAK